MNHKTELLLADALALGLFSSLRDIPRLLTNGPASTSMNSRSGRPSGSMADALWPNPQRPQAGPPYGHPPVGPENMPLRI